MSLHPELSRRIQVRSLGLARPATDGTGSGLETVVEATPAECRAMAQRLQVPAVASLRCRFRLDGVTGSGIVEADGLLHAVLTRTCVATLEDFETNVVEPFQVRFVPAERLGTQPDEALDLDADDDVPYGNGTIDLGEAAVEQLALALDPYPRKPGAELPADIGRGDPPANGHPVAEDEADDDGTVAERRPNPFAVLGRLRRSDD